jgi:hypothetical protein
MQRRGGEAALAASDVLPTPSESAVAKRWRACVPVRLRYVLASQIMLLMLMRCVQLYQAADAPPTRHNPSSPLSRDWRPDRASKPPSAARATWPPPHQQRGAARLHPPASHHGGGNVGQVEAHDHLLANDVEDGAHGPLRAWASVPSPRSMPPFRLAAEQLGKPAAAAQADDSADTEVSWPSHLAS